MRSSTVASTNALAIAAASSGSLALAVTETMLLSATGVTSTWASRSSGEPDASGTPLRLCWARLATSVVLIRRATVSTARSGSTEPESSPTLTATSEDSDTGVTRIPASDS